MRISVKVPNLKISAYAFHTYGIIRAIVWPDNMRACPNIFDAAHTHTHVINNRDFGTFECGKIPQTLLCSWLSVCVVLTLNENKNSTTIGVILYVLI